MPIRPENRCEGSPAYPDCRPERCHRENLRAWCQRCHNTYDAPMRRAGVRKRRDLVANAP